MGNKGVTLIELLIVIVVLGIIAAFAIGNVGAITDNARVGVDSYNLDVLNEVTEKYGNTISIINDDIFNGEDTDTDRMIKLVEEGYLTSVIQIQQVNASFEWDINNQKWNLIGGEYTSMYSGSGTSYDFSSDTVTTISSNGSVSPNMSKWSTDDGYLENTTGETRIFIPISKATYTITTTSSLSAGTNGGYGVFFDITLKDGNESKDNGYILQFDRGYGSGAFIVRPRVNGGERGAVWTLRATDTNLFNTKQNDPDWWTDSHTIKIVVSNVDNDTRKAEFYLDGSYLGEYEYDNEIAGQQIYTGYRGWAGSPTQFYDLTIN
jgi:prepilin-type N-terminal cleavage/methylation domain-containing protein